MRFGKVFGQKLPSPSIHFAGNTSETSIFCSRVRYARGRVASAKNLPAFHRGFLKGSLTDKYSRSQWITEMQVARNVQAGNGMEDGALRFCIIRQPGYIVYVPYRHTVCLFINTGIIMMLHTHYFYPAITALHKSVRRYTSYLKVLFLPKKKN